MSRESFYRLERELLDYLEDAVVPFDVDLVYWPASSTVFRAIAERDKIVWKQN